MDAYIKYSSGDDSVIQNFQYLLVNSNNGNEKISKDEVSKEVFMPGKQYTFVGNKTVSIFTATISHVEFID
ncbi:TPA: hypothetical protein SLD01_000813 [Staphylococcus aureus]|uniref:hypothetical protein n=1 Tax=Staphylococcus aureus TaxID=1280 RepID=UPI000446FDF3|nr:hypothetical protein [Staphylococcus aureus]VTS31392.1 Uncharacterised protein [Staphylococcus hyicus]EJX2086058.1 hypothetical protein [Staphylococcus aureus]EZH90026.1 hypothetical protein SA21267_1200 [Staphylococcus aureus subsp. aureus 21267]MBV2930484.1 hypothetical protein [Staphylococcus aureus]MBV2946212.1 hypothetical protein [Staphylococcus aureus]